MADWVTGVIAGVSGIAGGAATQWFTLIKESRVSKKAQFRDMQYIGVHLILRLTEFSVHCRKISEDEGKEDTSSMIGNKSMVASVTFSPLILDDIQGKWDALPAQLLFRIRELPLVHTNIQNILNDSYHRLYDAPEHAEYFRLRKVFYRKQTRRVDEMIEELRMRCQLPEEHDIYD